MVADSCQYRQNVACHEIIAVTTVATTIRDHVKSNAESKDVASRFYVQSGWGPLSMSLKIGFVEPHLRLFGGIRRVMELSNRLVERGHVVTLYHSDGSPCEWMEGRARTRPAEQVLSDQNDVLIYNDPRKLDYELVKKARAALKVHYVLELYRKNLLKGFQPLLYLLRWRGIYRRMYYLKQSLYARHIDLLLVNASWMQQWLQEHLGLESTLLLGGVNREVFHPVAVPAQPGSIRILYSGDPRPWKGTATVSAAIELVQKRVPALSLQTYYGKGIPQEKMAEVYSNADIFVDGQFSAGWNNPVAEAMACHTAVVCTDIGGVQDFAFHEQTALLVPPGDSTAMAEAILRLIQHPELRNRLRDNALEYIRRFDWDVSAQQLEELLLTHLRRKTATSVRGES